MRILSCHIEAFGAMRNRSFPDLNAPVVIVEGSNEAGKSTFFHFLQTMLYGIYPVSEEKHPYAPRDGARMEGSLTMQSDQGEQCTVTRRLRGTVAGEIVWPDGRSEALGNRNAPLMHISKEVYAAMYALSLYDLVALQDKEKAWQVVQDRLVGGLGVDFIRSAREVVGQIEQDASALWRPDRRGRPESKTIAAGLKALAQEIREAKRRDRELRDLSDQVERYALRDRDLSGERKKLRAKQRRIKRLAPIRERLRQIADAKREAGDPAELDGLPADPGAAMDAIREEMEKAETQAKQLDAEREQAGQILDAAEAGAGFDLKMDSGNPYEGLLQDRDRAAHDLRQAQGDLVNKARNILTEPWSDPFANILEGIAPAELRERMNRFDDAQREADTRRQAEEAHKQAVAMQRASEPDADAVRKAFRVRALLAGLLLAGALAAGAVGRGELAVGLGAAGAIAGYMAWQARTQTRREAASPATSIGAGRSLEDIQADMDVRRAAVRDLMGGLPVPASRFERPDMMLVGEVISLQDAVRMRQRAQTNMTARMADLKTLAQRRQNSIAEARRALGKEQASFEAERNALNARLSELGGGDAEQGMVVVGKRKKSQQLAQTLEEKLATDFPGEDMAKARREIEELDREDAAWSVSDEEAVEIDERLDQLEEEINALTEQRAEAKKDIEDLREQPARDILESKREQLESELETVKERHDRLRLLQSIVREADRRFREAHQPDVLKRASGYVRTITGGRYERFDYDEDENLRAYPAGHPDRPASGRPWPVEAPLSQGTLDQIYLAIRFALVDHLDESKESLPVLLDETFVNCDPDRRRRCYEIFPEAAARRQTFVFTCHPWLAEEMEQALSAKRILL